MIEFGVINWLHLGGGGCVNKLNQKQYTKLAKFMIILRMQFPIRILFSIETFL